VQPTPGAPRQDPETNGAAGETIASCLPSGMAMVANLLRSAPARAGGDWPGYDAADGPSACLYADQRWRFEHRIQPCDAS
jgi:hypothetical protein